MLIYMFGSIAMCYNSSYLTTPNIRWIGLRSDDILHLKNSILPLQKSDLKKLKSIEEKEYLLLVPHLKDELSIMTNIGKVEIEALLGNEECLINLSQKIRDNMHFDQLNCEEIKENEYISMIF